MSDERENVLDTASSAENIPDGELDSVNGGVEFDLYSGREHPSNWMGQAYCKACGYTDFEVVSETPAGINLVCTHCGQSASYSYRTHTLVPIES